MEFNISRYKNIEKVTYDCEVITPMFLAGANQKEAELRTQSIKGALRFWWRALYGKNYNLQEMKGKESDIFGSTEKKSKINITLSDSKINTSSEKLHSSGFHILNYLAYRYDDNLGNIRKHIKPKSTFKINVILNVNGETIEKLLNVINVFINYNGLGAKSRNGFGSIHCKEYKETNISDFFKGELKDYTAFSNKSKIFNNYSEKNSWKESLIQIGEIYKNAKKKMKDLNIDRSLIAKPFKNDHSRYSKPYFFHINKLDNGRYKGKILFLPHIYQNNNVSQEKYMSACESLNNNLKGGS